jgi:hypothetical protein
MIRMFYYGCLKMLLYTICSSIWNLMLLPQSHRRIKSSDLLELITSSTDIRFEKIHSYWKARKRSEGLVFVGILMITQNGALAFVGLRKFPSWMMQKTPMTMRQMSWVKICMSEMLTHSPMDVEIKRLQILQRSRGA